MSPDPYDGSMDLSNPQSLNRYAYVGNMPLTLTDPSGLDGELPGLPGAGGVGGCAGVIYYEGQNPYADVGCGLFLLDKLFEFFRHPKLKAATRSRPNAQIWDEHGSFHPNPNAGIGDLLGLSGAGCEFGACGSNFGPGDGGSSTMTMAGGTFINFPYLFSLIHLTYFDSSDPNRRLFGTHYCGPGGGGGATGGLDQLCAAHDACYSHSGVSTIDNLNPFTSGAAMGGCDRLLCYSLQNFQPTSPQERSGKDHIQQIFGCGYILKQ
jgi:hypothetical protein